MPTTSAPTVAELADRVVALCETTFAAVDGLRGVADQLLLPFSQGAAPAAADVAPIDGPVRQILDVPRSPLVGAGLVVAPDVLADARHWMQWWTRDDAGRPRQLQPELDAEEESFFDYTVLPWFTVPRDTGRRHVTGPYVDWLCTQEYTLTFTVPVFGTHPERGRCHLGVVGADIVAGWLERRLLPLLHRMDGPVALVNAEGRVVVANRPALVTGAVLRQVDVPALWRRDPGGPPAGDAVLHRLPDLPLGVLLLDGSDARHRWPAEPARGRRAGGQPSVVPGASSAATWRRTSSMSSARTWPIRSSRAVAGRAPGSA